MYRSSPLRSALNMCASAKDCHHPHPTPPYPMWCVRGWLLVEKWCKIVPVCTCDSSLCARVTLENGCVRTWLQSVGAGDSGKWLCAHVTPVCVRGWLWKMAVCARDSSLCARVTLGGKNDTKLCLCVLVTPECVRGWPPDHHPLRLRTIWRFFSFVKQSKQVKDLICKQLFCWEGIDWLQDFFLHGRLSNWPLIGEVTTRLLYQQPRIQRCTTKHQKDLEGLFERNACDGWNPAPQRSMSAGLRSCPATVQTIFATNHWYEIIFISTEQCSKSWLFAVCKDYFINQYKIL